MNVSKTGCKRKLYYKKNNRTVRKLTNSIIQTK